VKAMRFHRPGEALRLDEIPTPTPAAGQVLVKVHACGVCRTDLHLVDSELPDPVLPIVPGHEIVGSVAGLGNGVDRFRIGDRVGIPWLGSTCGHCDYCAGGNENLCDEASFTGYRIDGGYAEYTVADARYCFAIPGDDSDARTAPLLCAGLIGYRALRMTGDPRSLGIYGFGAAGHIITQLARWQGRRVFAFTRSGDVEAQSLALKLGAEWAGDSGSDPGEPLAAAIIFAPVGALVPEALARVAKGGSVVCAGIHMSEIPAFPYRLLWGERTVRSVANLTRRDAEEFLELAPRVPIRPEVVSFPLEEANQALRRLRAGELSGAAVLTMD
jgi:propanol-preferring alcohol dehydrogenase